MLLTGLLAGALVVMFILSRLVTQHIFNFFNLLFRSRPVAVTCILLLQFPGTVLHELSHLFTAEILGVRTGKLRLEPESIRDENIQAGSVMIAETDPVRRYAIGMAPLGSGMIILTALSYILPGLWTSVSTGTLPLFQNPDLYWLMLSGYLLFAVSNSMFPSPEDVRGITPLLIIVVLLVLAGYLIGLRFELTGNALTVVTSLITTLTKSLGIVIALNVVLFLLTHLGIRIYTRIFRVQIIPNILKK